jgi:hypothetical protein
MVEIFLTLVAVVRADCLQLKHGNFVQGKYLGGSERTVQFEVNGKARLYNVNEILSISFGAASADGVISSDDVDSSLSAKAELNSATEANHVLGATILAQAKLLSVPAQQVGEDQKRLKSSDRVALQRLIPAQKAMPRRLARDPRALWCGDPRLWLAATPGFWVRRVAVRLAG